MIAAAVTGPVAQVWASASNPFGEPAPSQWARRVPLTLLVVGVVVLLTWLCARGYARRAASQSDLPPPPAPPASTGAELLPALRVRYLGTSLAGQWLERVAAHGLGLPSEGTVRLVADGVVLERTGSLPVLLPAASLTGARLEPGFLGRVVGTGGVLVLSWRLGERELDTGVRAEDRAEHPRWVEAVAELARRSGRLSEGSS